MHSEGYELGTICFFFNDELKGDVKIQLPTDAVDVNGQYSCVTVSGKTLESFILNRLRVERIAELEHAEDEDLKKLLGGRRD